jgi:peptidyl-prolyl cis-trans isomerase SurA
MLNGIPLARVALPCLASLLLAVAAPIPASVAAPVPPPKALDATRIVAIVNGDVISNADVANRARLFALSTGLPIRQDLLDRLKPQITRQLVDERLRMQEVQRRKIVISDQQIADAIHEIETRNNMPQGALRSRLAADGVSQRTLIDQIRTQLGWTQVLREELAGKLHITDDDVAAEMRAREAQVGKPEYRVGEIFIPVDDPSNTAEAQRFSETVITELRAGAPFPVVAAEFSQSQTALSGGELGWVQPNQLDPQVARLVTEMPVGAISNPVKVPGGFSIVTLQGKREVGRDITTVLNMRQVFLPFSSPLNPQAPTEQQRQTLDTARHISATVHSCAQMEEVAKTHHSSRPADPGEVRLEGVNPPAFRQMLASLQIGHTSQPIVSNDGIAVIVVCSREQRNLAAITKEQVRNQIVNERVELMSRQLLRDLRRQATIDLRTGES